MKQIRRKCLAVLLALFQMVSIISPFSTAAAATYDGGYFNNAFNVFIHSNAAALNKLADDNYYLVVGYSSSPNPSYKALPFSTIKNHNENYASFTGKFKTANGDEVEQTSGDSFDYYWTIAAFDAEPTPRQMEACLSPTHLNGQHTLDNGVVINIDENAHQFSANLAYNKITVYTYDTDGTTPKSPDAQPAAPIEGYYVRVKIQHRTNINPETWEDAGWNALPVNFASGATSALVTVEGYVNMDQQPCQNKQSLNPADPDYRIDTVEYPPRMIKARNTAIEYTNGFNDAKDKTKIDDTAPDGYEYKTGSTDPLTGGWQIPMNRAKPVNYQVRLVLKDTAAINELGQTGDLYVLVNVAHKQAENGQGVVTYAYQKINLSTMSHPDQEGNLLIDVPFFGAKWYDKNGREVEGEQYTGNELRTIFSIVGLPANTEPAFVIDDQSQWNNNGNTYRFIKISNGNQVTVGDYINRYQVTGTENTIREPSADGTKTNIIDSVILEKNEDHFGLYSLEKILNGGYNVVTLCKGPYKSMPTTVLPENAPNNIDVGQGDAFIGCHQMGGLLIRGDVTFTTKVTGIADSPDADNPSVIGGYFGDTNNNICFVNARTNNSDNVPFYLGSSNTVVGYSVNGKKYFQQLTNGDHGINYCGDTIVNDDYVNWDLLQSNIKNASRALANASSGNLINATNNSVITVDVGSNVTINCDPGDQITINLKVPEGMNAYETVTSTVNGQVVTLTQLNSQLPGTVINFRNSTGTMIAPKLQVNGLGLQTVETGAGISVVYNYPNLTGTVQGPEGSEFGHIVAPQALIKIKGGNYSGTMVGNNAYIGADAEGHLYPYHGGTLVGFYGNITAEKQIDGQDPTDKQTYQFIIEQLRGDALGQVTITEYEEIVAALETSDNDKVFWEKIQEAHNEREQINFTDISFYRSGKYYFRITEDLAYLKPNVQGDETQYLIECEVEPDTSGSTNKLRIKEGSIKYYEINPSLNLLTVENIYDAESHLIAKKPVINDAAVTEKGALSWDNSNNTIESPITFFNEFLDADATITFTGTKTYNAGDLTNTQFHFQVIQITRDENNNITEQKVVSTGTSNADNTITFRPIGYKSAELGSALSRTYEYIVKEVRPDGADDTNNYTVDGITYDHNEYTVFVTVTKDEQTGELTADYSGTPPVIEFTNNREATGSAQFSAYKTLDGKAKDGFTFILSDGTNTYTAESGQDGYAVFDPISFVKNATQDDTANSPYTYTIREDVPSDAVNSTGVTYEQATNKEDFFTKNGVVYDGHIKTVEVTVTDDGTKTLAVRYDGESTLDIPSFANKSLVSIPVKKAYSGTPDAGTQAVFTLLRYTETAPTGTISINHTAAGDRNAIPDTVVYKANGKEIHSGDTLETGDYTISVLNVSVDGYTEETVIDPNPVSITKNNTTTVNITTTYTQQPGVLKIEHLAAGALSAMPLDFTATYSVSGPQTVDNADTLTPVSVKPGEYTVTETITNAATPEGYSVTESERTVTVTVPSNGTGTATFTSTYTRDKGTLNLSHTINLPDGKTNEAFTYTLSDGTVLVPGENLDIPTGTYTLTVSGGAIDGYNATTVIDPESITVSKDDTTNVDLTTTYAEKVTVIANITAEYNTSNGNIVKTIDNTNFVPGDKVIISFDHQCNNNSGTYSILGGNDNDVIVAQTPFSQNTDYSKPLTERIPCTIPADGIVRLIISETWGDMERYSDSFHVELDNTSSFVQPDPSMLIASASGAPRRARRIMGYIASTTPVQGSSASVISKPQEGYDQDTSFAMEVTLTSPSSLEGIFEDLELKDENGRPYHYYLYESRIPDGYLASDPVWIHYDELETAADSSNKETSQKTITNTKTGKVQFRATKTYLGGNDTEHVEITAILKDGNGDPVESIKLNAGNNFTGTFSELEQYDTQGQEIDYSGYTVVEETVPAGYEVSYGGDAAGGFTITNTKKISSVKVTKAFSGLNKLPAEFKITNNYDTTLEFNVDNAQGSGTLADPYYWIIDNVPLDTEVVFTETGIIADGYNLYVNGKATTVDSATVTAKSTENTVATAELVNIYNKLISVAIKKVWDDDNNREGKRPDKLVIDLLADGNKVDSVTLSDANNWIAQIRDLEECNASGTKIVYSWSEPSVKGYTLTGTVKHGTITTLTNSYTPGTTQIKVEKVWVDNGQHQNEIKVQLYADGRAVGDAVKLNAANNWKYRWDDLCKYDAGSEIRYTVAETDVPAGYVSTISGNASEGFVITNTLQSGKLVIEKAFDIRKPEEKPEEEEKKTEIEVVKIWDDNDNKDGNRPDKITVRLYAGGKEVSKAELSAANGWRKTFGELPKYVNGRPIKYSVTEDPVKWYAADIKGFTITNRYIPQTVEVSIQKVWNDAGYEWKRPKSITVMLNNGMSVKLNEKNGWHAVISGLPKYVDGKEMVYTWTEKSVLGYYLEDQKTIGTHTIITNAPHKRSDEPKRGGKTKKRGRELYPLSDYETPLGVDVMINHVGDCFD